MFVVGRTWRWVDNDDDDGDGDDDDGDVDGDVDRDMWLTQFVKGSIEGIYVMYWREGRKQAERWLCQHIAKLH